MEAFFAGPFLCFTSDRGPILIDVCASLGSQLGRILPFAPGPIAAHAAVVLPVVVYINQAGNLNGKCQSV